MITTNIDSIADLNRTAIKVLVKEIGIVNTGRFLSQYSSEFGNYTDERDELLGNPTLEAIVAEINEQQSGPSGPAQQRSPS